jgi:hypothetical protein
MGKKGDLGKSVFLVLGMLAGLATSLHAVASDTGRMEVRGRAYSATECRYYHSSRGDFLFRYAPSEVWSKDVVRVDLVYRFRDTFNGVKETQPTRMEMRRGSRGPFEFDLTDVQVDLRGESRFTSLRFFLELELRDGSRVTDRGGAFGQGFEVTVPERACSRGPFQVLTPDAVPGI